MKFVNFPECLGIPQEPLQSISFNSSFVAEIYFNLVSYTSAQYKLFIITAVSKMDVVKGPAIIFLT